MPWKSGPKSFCGTGSVVSGATVVGGTVVGGTVVSTGSVTTGVVVGMVVSAGEAEQLIRASATARKRNTVNCFFISMTPFCCGMVLIS